MLVHIISHNYILRADFRTEDTKTTVACVGRRRFCWIVLFVHLFVNEIMCTQIQERKLDFCSK